MGEGQTKKVLELTDENGDGNTACKSRGNGVGDELYKSAEFKNAHQDEHNTCKNGCNGKSFNSLGGNDTRNYGCKGCGRTADLDTAAAEKSADKAGYYGGVKSNGGTYAGCYCKGYREGESDDRNDKTCNKVICELLFCVFFQTAEKTGHKGFHYLSLSLYGINFLNTKSCLL